MRSLSILAFAASFVSAGPLSRRAPPTQGSADTFVAQFALTLEHLEVAFYAEGLAKFDAPAFARAGFESFVRPRMQQIHEHEQTHVTILSQHLTAQHVPPVQPCQYAFPLPDAKAFVALSRTLEEGGQAAYLGAAPLLQNKDFFTTAAAILVTEGRQAGWLGSAVQKEQPWSGAFGVGLDAQQVFSVANQFIKSCPHDNFNLSLTPFPAITLNPPAPHPGETLTLSYAINHAGDEKLPHFLALKVASQLQPIFVPITNGKATLPMGLQGIVFAVVTKTDKDASSASTLAGPAALDFSFNANANN